MGRIPWVERVGRLGDGFDVVVAGAGTELARPGVAPGAHLRVVPEPGPAARAGARPAARPRLRGRLVGKIPAEDIHGTSRAAGSS